MHTNLEQGHKNIITNYALFGYVSRTIMVHN